MVVTPLIWDSSFFGIRIGKATISSKEEAEALMRMAGQLRNAYDLIYVFSDMDLVFPSPALRLVDKKATYLKTLHGTDSFHPSAKEWTSGETTTELEYLAWESGQYSRFKTDSRFPAGSYERLYSRWIGQSVRHVIATNVFYFQLDGKPRGLVTLNAKDESGSLGLVSIDKEYQHRHIGSALIHHVCAYSYQRGIRTLSVATQTSNIPACRFYERMGFSLESAVNVWHWWLDYKEE
jgi:dTDP-4-amino-4,6-dideoxy-D-galactose acyltransferase